MLEIVVDSRIRMPLSQLGDKAASQIRERFDHRNAKHFRLKKMGYWPKGEPPIISTWSEEHGDLTVPRGGFKRVREVLDQGGVRWTWRDARTLGDRTLGNPPRHRVTLYDYQVRSMLAAIERETCIVRLPTGCIAGDALIGINRAGKGQQVRIDHLVKMHQGGTAGGKRWDQSIPTMVRARLDDGSVGLVRLLDAYESGEKVVFEVRTASGHVVQATRDHRFLTVDGWKPLGEVCPGDLIYVEESRRPKRRAKTPRSYYRLRVARCHPFRGRRGVKPSKGGNTVPEHRLVFEANLNGIPFDEFMVRVNEGPTEGLVFLDPSLVAVHHRDENPHNNSIENLQALSHEDHFRLHGRSSDGIKCRTVASEVVSISEVGVRSTYDLELESPHNFIASGCVVHNSGKTTLCLALAARVQVPTLVVVHTNGLLNQWAERAEKEMGIARADLGLIKGKVRRLRPLTIAMQQTLNRADEATWTDINRTFGAVIADEVHLFAASTFLRTLDRCRARYRIGVSADHTRADRKEFLTTDVFSEVAAEVSREELIAREFVHDVEVLLEPTSFEAPWYEEQRRVARMRDDGMELDDIYAALLAEKPGLSVDDVPSGPPDYTRLIEEMCASEARNDQIVALAGDLVQRGHRLLVYSHRVEHCRMLASRLVGAGVRCGLLLGGEYQEEFESTIARIKSGDASVGIGTWQAMGTGIDVPNVDRGIVTTPIQTKQLWGQIRGRLCRTSEGKEGARAHVMWDRRVFGNQTVRNMTSWNTLARVRTDDGRIVVAREYLGGRK